MCSFSCLTIKKNAIIHLNWWYSNKFYSVESKVLQYFGRMWGTIRQLWIFCQCCKGDEQHRIVRHQARLIISERYSPNLLLRLGTRLQNTPSLVPLTLPNRRGSCNPREMSSTISLLYWNQLRLRFLHNYFWLLPQHYGWDRTRKAQLPN